jgi:hypothetical protein
MAFSAQYNAAKIVRFLLGTELADSQPLHAIDQGRRIGLLARPNQKWIDCWLSPETQQANELMSPLIV